MTNSVTTLLANLLPAAPAQLLLLGDDVNGWAADLEAKGFSVSHQRFCEPPDFVQYPSASRSGIGQVCISQTTVASAPFAGVLVLDFSPAVHALALFDQLAGLAADGAVVLLLGQHSADKPPRMTRWLDYAVAIAGRCGFSTQAPAEVASTSENGFFVRALRKAMPPRWQVSHVRPKDFTAVATLFQAVFGHVLSRELWDWKYAAGSGNAVAASHKGVLIAHYGGIYRDVLLYGKPDWFLQICDVMVHPAERGVLTRQGPFFLTASTSAELYGPFGFGFPNARHMRVGEKMALYSKAAQMVEIRWEPSLAKFCLRTRVRSLERHSVSDGVVIQQLWAAMAHDLRGGVVGVRDQAYLERRYWSHPHNHYELLLVTARLTGKPLGVMVLHRLEGSCELMDIVAPLANVALVLDQARRMAGRWQCGYLHCWATQNHAPLFLACEGKEHPLDVIIPTSCWTADPRAESFKDKWWLMSGDTDFR